MSQEYYVLDSNFVKREVINDSISIIWTDRFNKPGDLQLVVPLSSENLNRYSLGTFIAQRDNKECMIIETQKIKDNTLTISGRSLLSMFANRVFGYGRSAMAGSPTYYPAENTDWGMGYPGLSMKDIVYSMVVSDSGPGYSPANMDDIPNLSIGAYSYAQFGSASGTVQIQRGDLLSVVEQLAELIPLGVSLYLDSVNEGGNPPYSIVFKNYSSTDRTTTQGTNPPIVFSEDAGNIKDLEELRSIKDYRNVCYVQIPQSIRLARSGIDNQLEIYRRVEVEPNPPVVGWNARAVYHWPDNLPAFTSETALTNQLEQRGRQVLAELRKQQLIEGTILNTPGTTYGVDYFMGDIVEIKGNFSTAQKARVIEYIYSQDETGEKEYPTLEFI